MVSTSSITTQSLGKTVLRTLAVGAKMWCLYVCFFCHALSPLLCAFKGDIFEQALCQSL